MSLWRYICIFFEGKEFACSSSRSHLEGLFWSEFAGCPRSLCVGWYHRAGTRCLCWFFLGETPPGDVLQISLISQVMCMNSGVRCWVLVFVPAAQDMQWVWGGKGVARAVSTVLVLGISLQCVVAGWRKIFLCCLFTVGGVSLLITAFLQDRKKTSILNPSGLILFGENQLLPLLHLHLFLKPFFLLKFLVLLTVAR